MFNKTTEAVKLQFELSCLENGVCRVIPTLLCEKCGTCSDPECTWD